MKKALVIEIGTFSESLKELVKEVTVGMDFLRSLFELASSSNDTTSPVVKPPDGSGVYFDIGPNLMFALIMFATLALIALLMFLYFRYKRDKLGQSKKAAP